jgi:hypothetical protein
MRGAASVAIPVLLVYRIFRTAEREQKHIEQKTRLKQEGIAVGSKS